MIDYTLPLDQLPDPLPIVPLTKPFDVTITPPGSKSITNRAYILAALAKGESRIVRPLRADDTDLLLEALCTLGAEAKWVPGDAPGCEHDGEDVLITGVNGRFPRGGEVNLGDGGTPTRFMIAAACLAAEPVVVDGSKRMRERPIAEGVDMLRQLGAKIEYVEEEGRLPVRVTPSAWSIPESFDLWQVRTSQFISALFLIAPHLSSPLSVRSKEFPPSVDYAFLTLEMLREWGIEWSGAECHFRYRIVTGSVQPHRYVVNADASSAVYWAEAASLTDSRVLLRKLSTTPWQADFAIFRIFREHGGIRETFPSKTEIEVTGLADLGRTREFAGRFPDGALTLCVALACGKRRSEITGLHTLRVKECDRLAALETELRKVGCQVETTEDSITIHPMPDDKVGQVSDVSWVERVSDPSFVHGSESRSTGDRSETCPTEPIIIETYNDHRMAMAFAVLGLRVPGIAIRNPAVVSKSYPTFWKDFAKLYG